VSGALIAGLVLSPAVIDLIGRLEPTAALRSADSSEISALANLGVILLLFLAGLDTDLNEFVRSGRGSVLVATGGVIVTLGLSTGAALLGGLPGREAFFVGVMLASTSVSISVQALLELGQLQTRMGLTILGAAVTDDIQGLVVFSIALAALGVSGVAPYWLVGGLVLYLGLSLVLGFRFAAPVVALTRRLRTTEGFLGAALAYCLLMGWLAQTAGLAAISGAYLGGLILGRVTGAELTDRLRTLAYGLPIPVFFVNVGMAADLTHVSGGILLLVMVPVATIAGKIIGCGAGALLDGLRGRRAALVGLGMIPRGEVSLVIATLGFQAGVLSETGYALGVLAVLITALVTPPALKILVQGGVTTARSEALVSETAA
jgi:Kef-type K+ transport system membrane component KefB